MARACAPWVDGEQVVLHLHTSVEGIANVCKRALLLAGLVIAAELACWRRIGGELLTLSDAGLDKIDSEPIKLGLDRPPARGLRRIVGRETGQLTKLLNLARGWALYTPSSPTFADVPTSNTFFQYIETTAHRGIATGYPCGGPGEPCDSQQRPYFRPGNNGTRGQLSKMLYITLDLHQTP